MSARDYVYTYLSLCVCLKDGPLSLRPVRNYLENVPKNKQAARAQIAKNQLLSALPKLAGLPAGKHLPNIFEVDGDQYIKTSLSRVYIGKGAPNEIQDALYLASLCGLVNQGNLAAYVEHNLGIDCGGFVANYWGMGRPEIATPNPVDATGITPRQFWNTNRSLQRKTADEIQEDDAAVFFEDVKSDDPNVTGSKAVHIALVSSVAVVAGTNQVNLEIAESSGGRAASGGDGVNVRSLGQVKTTVAKERVYFLSKSGATRIYFVGQSSSTPPYPPNFVGM